jgi:hypothetical protein
MPRTGWSVVDVVDEGEPSHTCEACGNPGVRYVHTVGHSAFRTLRVGCVCAGHLTGDSSGPRRRELHLRRRIAWADRRWRRSRRGNPWIKARGHHVVVFRAGSGGYRVMIDGEHVFGDYPNEYAAKLASYDGLAYVEREYPRAKD